MTEADLRLFSYKLTHDTGFAPNPFHGVCTLATCKPRIRESKRVGDWIAGFTSNGLNGDRVGFERLVYLMQVDEKLPFETYYADPRFAAKIPRPESERWIDTVGDNIYGRRSGTIFQVPNPFHSLEHLSRDTGGRFVLIASVFAYFGSAPLAIPEEVRPEIPSGVSAQGSRTRDPQRAEAFLDFVLKYGTGVHARPTIWRSADSSWQQGDQCA